MATAKILHTFPRRPLMGLDAPKADRDTDHDLAIASVLGSPPGPLADGRDATAGGLHSLALAAVIPYAVGNGLALFFSVILLGLRVGGHHEQNTKG